MTGFAKSEALWSRLLMTVGIASAGLALAAAIFLSLKVDFALKQLQNDINVSRGKAFLHALDMELENLGNYTSGYAMWDDTHEFLKKPGDLYIERNFSPEVIQFLPIQLVGVYDLEGRLVFGVSYDTSAREMSFPMWLRSAEFGSLLRNIGTSREFVGGVTDLEGGTYLLTVSPVRNSVGKDPNGYLVFGKAIGAEFFDQLRLVTDISGTFGRERNLENPVEMPGVHTGRVLVGMAESPDSSGGRMKILLPDTLGPAPALVLEFTNRTKALGGELGRLIATVLLFITASFIVFVAWSAWARILATQNLERSRAESRKLAEAKKVAEELAFKATAADKAKADFLAMMSHEIRTPLNAIMGYTELLRTTPGHRDSEEHLEVIGTNCALLRHILDDVLDYSRIEAGQLSIHKQPVSLRNLIETVVKTFKPLADAKDNTMSWHVEPGIPEILLLDEMRLRQVLGNLVSNAVKFTNSGSISVAAREHSPGTNGHRTLLLEVTDTGMGVCPKLEPNLFRPFVQGDLSPTKQFGGTGLGLAICKNLCQLMGGTIEFNRGQQSGSVFRVTLPMEIPVQLEEPKVQSSDARKLDILIVDDNHANIRLLQSMLKASGHSCLEARSGEEALDLFTHHGADLVFMDIHMPGLGGFQAAEAIRKIEQDTKNVPCTLVAVTADGFVRSNVQKGDTAFDEVVEKPITLKSIREIVDRAETKIRL